MHKIIHSKFEIDLTNYEMTTVEDNFWFSNSFFTKYSFPANLYLTDDLLVELGYFLDDNNLVTQTLFDVTYVQGNKKESAIFQIKSQVGRKLKFVIRYGFDELPNWNKSLRDLPLEYLEVNDIADHAATIIPNIYPTVNYNFPQIHDEFLQETETFSTFLGIINNCKINNSGQPEFRINEHDSSTFANRNIIQPLPSLMHVLKQGFLDAGYDLQGEVVDSGIYNDVWLYCPVKYYDEIEEESYNLKIYQNDYSIIVNGVFYKYEVIYNDFQPNNSYNISGYIEMIQISFAYPSYLKIYHNEILIINEEVSSSGQVSIDVTVEILSTTDFIKIELINTMETAMPDDFVVADLDIIRVLNEEEDLPNEVHFLNVVDLKKSVQNRTFGDLVTEVRKQLNLTLSISDNVAYLNFIKNQMNYDDAVDLSNVEILEVPKEFEDNRSFLLKLTETENQPETMFPVYQNASETIYSEDEVDNDTKTVELEMIPLPIKFTNQVATSYKMEEGDEETFYFVKYSGWSGSPELNLCSNPSEFFPFLLHLNYHKTWFDFRINSINRIWKFYMYEEDVQLLNKKVYAYNRYHVIKVLEKTQVAEELYEVELEVESLP